MKIQCKLERKGGTEVALDTTNYHFKPSDQDPRHLADVTIEPHIRRFLSIAEGYAKADASDIDLPPEKLAVSDTFNATVAIGSVEFTREELTAAAQDASGLSIAEWNAQSLDERDQLVQDEIDLRKADLLDTRKQNPDDHPPVVLQGTDWQPTEMEIDGKLVTTVEIVEAAFKASGLTAAEWNALSKEDAGARMQAEVESRQPQASAATEVKAEVPLAEQELGKIEDSMSPQVKRGITRQNNKIIAAREAAKAAQS